MENILSQSQIIPIVNHSKVSLYLSSNTGDYTKIVHHVNSVRNKYINSSTQPNILYISKNYHPISKPNILPSIETQHRRKPPSNSLRNIFSPCFQNQPLAINELCTSAKDISQHIESAALKEFECENKMKNDNKTEHNKKLKMRKILMQLLNNKSGKTNGYDRLKNKFVTKHSKPTFSKEKRFTLAPLDKSPGPGSYNLDKSTPLKQPLFLNKFIANAHKISSKLYPQVYLNCKYHLSQIQRRIRKGFTKQVAQNYPIYNKDTKLSTKYSFLQEAHSSIQGLSSSDQNL